MAQSRLSGACRSAPRRICRARPEASITDLNTRWGRKYYEGAQDLSNFVGPKEPPGIALIGNLIGSTVSKYMDQAPDLSNVGTQANDLFDRAKQYFPPGN